MTKWLLDWARQYDLSYLNFGICLTGAFAAIWVTQCMMRVPTSPRWAMAAIYMHRFALLVIAVMFVFTGVTPFMAENAYPWTGDVILRAALVLMLLIWPMSSRARRLYGGDVHENDLSVRGKSSMLSNQ